MITRRAAGVLLAAAAWTLFIWITRISNILGDDDRSTGFKVVHVVLALVSVLFAIAIAVIGWRALRTAGRSERLPGA